MSEEIEIPKTGDPRVDAAFERVRARFTDLEDAMLVSAMLEKRAGERMEEHASFIAFHERTMVELERLSKEHAVKMAKIDGKLNLMIDREMRREGGPEMGGLRE